MLNSEDPKPLIKKLFWLLYQLPGDMYFLIESEFGHKAANAFWRIFGNEFVLFPIVYCNKLLGNINKSKSRKT